MNEVIEAGKAFEAAGKAKTTEPNKDHTFMFSYTSGTTGDPKGVKLTHKMIINCSFAVNARVGDVPITENDCYVSYLPLAHSFE